MGRSGSLEHRLLSNSSRYRSGGCQRSREAVFRSEEHTSELQSQSNLVCRLLLEKKKQLYVSAALILLYYLWQETTWILYVDALLHLIPHFIAHLATCLHYSCSLLERSLI